MDEILIKFNKSEFIEQLTTWYEQHKRNLPWRKTNDPYRIWVSEIMLQQTKVDTVIDYYERFMEMYPTVFDLAKAEEQEVLKVWEGLGYYSRARNLHSAAKEVVSRFQGIVPDDPKLLGELKGIGPYTKGAISSIAFKKPEAAVDGNVMRVLSRVLYIRDNISDMRTRKRFENIIQDIIIHADPSSFNQGLMELGALICTPKKPACLLCPVKENCRALEFGEVENVPVKLKKKKQRVERYAVLLVKDETGNIAIEQRPNTGLLANMWQFPMVNLYTADSLSTSFFNTYYAEIKVGDKLGEVKHVFSHIIWELEIYEAVALNIEKDTKLFFTPFETLQDYPFSVSHQKVKDYLVGEEV